MANFVNEFFINVGKVEIADGSTPGRAGREVIPTALEQTTAGDPPGDLPASLADPETSADLDQSPGSNPPFQTESCDNSIKLNPEKLKELEVYKVIREINTSKSSGLNNISSFILKEAFGYLVAEVTFMYNLSLRTSQFPKAWKKALVIPIPKTGDLTQVKNYRPISLLPLPGKVLEKLVHSQLSVYLEAEGLLAPEQHGFRKGHSTIHSAAQLTSFISSKMDVGLPTLVTYIDFRKAFDCVQHPVLISKLARLNLDQSFIDWIESYLTSREQRVLANGVYSPDGQITQGVPQGSVLGPLFYIIYANDIINTVKHCKVALYADDTVLFTASNNFQKSVISMQKDIDALSVWCNTNGIKANTEKTKVMVFGSSSRLKLVPEFTLQFGGTPLQQVSSYKYLGITLDGQLNFNAHVNKIVASASSKLKQFQRMRGFLSTKAALLVYKCMLLPILEYGDIFLSATTLLNRKKLQILQNKGLRCALNKGLDTSREILHEEARILRLQYRREQHLLNFMFDWASDPSKLRAKPKTGVVTRSSSRKLLRTKRPYTEKLKKSLAYYGAKKWNALPSDIHQVLTKASFKQSIANWVSNKALANNQTITANT